MKQARALLWTASWLQYYMYGVWAERGDLVEEPNAEEEVLFAEYQLALIGAGETGKTTVLRLIEALIDHSAGAESVRTCAISNTAARLLGGDTMYALCKLPLQDLRARRGRLSSRVLKERQLQWRSAAACFVDEVSMVAPEQLLQADVRIRQAKGEPWMQFGGLGMVYSGDILQLPPVDTHSLAEKVDEVGQWSSSVADTQDGSVMQARGETPVVGAESGAEVGRVAAGEAMQGIDLWRAVRNVVTLTVNIRAPGLLGQLQGEMREGAVSSARWALYESRIVLPEDPRLCAPPFDRSPWNYIVHRQAIRAMQSFRNAKARNRTLGRRLYVVTASDVVQQADEEHFTPTVREELLRRANPRVAKHLPSNLRLYVGMRRLLYSKDCVRLAS